MAGLEPARQNNFLLGFLIRGDRARLLFHALFNSLARAVGHPLSDMNNFVVRLPGTQRSELGAGLGSTEPALSAVEWAASLLHSATCRMHFATHNSTGTSNRGKLPRTTGQRP